jgi:hypothetical protein
MRRSRFVTIAVVVCAAVAVAEEVAVPEFSARPAVYKSRFEDKLLIGDRTKESLKFWVNVSGAN